MALAPDGKTLATGSEDGLVRILDVASQRVVRELKGLSEPNRSVAYSPDGATIVAAASDQARGKTGGVLAWRVADGTPASFVRKARPCSRSRAALSHRWQGPRRRLR